MSLVRSVLGLVVFVFLLFLIGRLILDWVQTLARDWRPHGAALVVAEVVYSVTDPPLRAIGRVVPPLRIGRVSVDLAFMILFLVTLIVLDLLR